MSRWGSLSPARDRQGAGWVVELPHGAQFGAFDRRDRRWSKCSRLLRAELRGTDLAPMHQVRPAAASTHRPNRVAVRPTAQPGSTCASSRPGLVAHDDDRCAESIVQDLYSGGLVTEVELSGGAGRGLRATLCVVGDLAKGWHSRTDVNCRGLCQVARPGVAAFRASRPKTARLIEKSAPRPFVTLPWCAHATLSSVVQ